LGYGFDDIEPVGPTVVVRYECPRASRILYFDPDVPLTDFGTQGELAAVAGGRARRGLRPMPMRAVSAVGSSPR
jgi:hypothetical protein